MMELPMVTKDKRRRPQAVEHIPLWEEEEEEEEDILALRRRM